MSDPNRTQLGAPPTLDPNRTVMGAAPTLNATQTIVPVQCPICKSHNPPGVMFCVECGLIFDRALPDDAFGAPVVRLPVLVDSTGREQPIRPGENVVGREADILVADPKVSRRHAALHSTEGAIEVEDLGSTNGTLLNGDRLEPNVRRALDQGDKVSFGGVEFTLSMPGAAGKTAMLPDAPIPDEFADSPPSSVDEGVQDRVEASPALPPAAHLSVDGVGQPLKAGINTLGRKPDNDVVLDDPYVSGRHVTIEVLEGEVFLTDVGSTNGTFLDGERLAAGERTMVDPESEIKIGGLDLRVHVADTGSAVSE